MRSTSPLRLRTLVAVSFVSLVWLGCTDSRDLTAPDDLGPNIRVVDQVALDHAIRVLEAHTDGLLALEAVVGTAVGVSEMGGPVVKVYLMRDEVGGIPVNVEGVTFVPEFSGELFSRQGGSQGKGGGKGKNNSVDRTAKFRPVPIGVSTGHPDISAGTVGARVIGQGKVYALSNNHVYADQNSAMAKTDGTGDNVLQPGAFDGGVNPADAFGTLHAFVPIVFSMLADNKVDAAIAQTTMQLLSNATPSDGYGTHPSTTTDAAFGQKVKKYGRTTGLTSGNIDAIHATVLINYGANGVARFVDQIIITPGTFSAGGDSGSLILVTTTTGKGRNRTEMLEAVGLLFAGSPFVTIANPIEAVLQRFTVELDGN